MAENNGPIFSEPPPAFPRPTPTFPHSPSFSDPPADAGGDPFARFGHGTANGNGHAPPPPAFTDAPGAPGATWAGFALPPDDPAPPPPPPVEVPARLPGPTQPGPAARGSSLPLVVGAVVLALVLGIGATLVAVQPWSSADARAPIDGSTGRATPPAQGSVGGYGGSTPPTSPFSAAPSDPAAQLVATAGSDEPSIDATVGEGRWVPQISSKYDGLSADGIVYDATTIWSDHAALRARYGAMLLNSSHYATFSAKRSIWVTIVPAEVTTSPDVANAWCDQQGFGADDCYAKRIGHQEYEDTTRHRG